MKDRYRDSVNKVEKACAGRTTFQGFCIFAVIYLIALASIIRSNFNYLDDMKRVLTGIDNWGSEFSRYISDLLSHVIHAGVFLTDISPLPQLLGAAIMIAASLIIIVLVRGERSFSLWDIIAMVPLGLSPYFLECLSYKYDAPYMALSVLACVVPLLFMNRHAVQYLVVIILGMLVMCMTYQASSGIFPMLVLLLGFRGWIQGKDTKTTILFLLESATGYVIGIGIFYLFLMKPVDTYVSNSLATSLKTVMDHYVEYIYFMLNDFKIAWVWIILALTVWFVAAAVLHTQRGRILTLIISPAVVGLMFLLSFGLYPFLSEPSTSCRAMYGIGVYIAAIGVGNLSMGGNQWDRWIPRILTLVLSYVFVIFACTYGNALSEQEEYLNFRMEEIIDDLTDLEEFNTEGEKVVQLVGTAGYAPVIENMSQNYNMLLRLVPEMFEGGETWGQYKFYNYYGMDNVVLDKTQNVSSSEYENWPVLHDNIYHTIYYQDDHFVVIIK